MILKFVIILFTVYNILSIKGGNELNQMETGINGLPNSYEPLSLARLINDDFNIFDYLRKVPTNRMSMSLDFKEADKEYKLEADIPGVAKHDIKLSVSNGILYLSAERKSETITEKDNIIKKERFYGKVTRSIHLPDNIDEDNITSKYENGVLELHIPKINGGNKGEKVITVK